MATKLIEYAEQAEGLTFVPDPYWVSPHQLIGVEIEVENIAYVDAFKTAREFRRFWTMDKDNSLRDNGYEFKCRPMLGADLLAGIDVLNRTLEDTNPKAKWSSRSSVHVHADVRFMDTTQLRNILLFYLAIERALVAKFPERRGNQYCVPFHTADDAIEAISEILYYVEKDMPILNVLRNMPRYHALNLKSIVKYGTLEFRHHSGTCDRARMRAWINTIMGIVKAGELEYERVLAATSSVRGVMELIEQLYGSYAHLITGIPSVRDHISLGIADLSTILLRAQRDRDAGGLSKCDEESSLFAKKFGAKLKKSAPKKVAKAKPIGVAIDDGVAVGIQRERGVAFAQAVDAVRQLNLDNHRRNR